MVDEYRLAWILLRKKQAFVCDGYNQFAAVVMEPVRTTEPEPGFLQGVRELCDQYGVVLVFDEISSGWRFTLGGAPSATASNRTWRSLPKRSAMAIPWGPFWVVGAVMEAAQETFISSTYWTESVGPTAALATIRKMQRTDVPAHAERIGRLYRDGLLEAGRQHGVPVRVTGLGPLLHIAYDHPESAGGAAANGAHARPWLPFGQRLLPKSCSYRPACRCFSRGRGHRLRLEMCKVIPNRERRTSVRKVTYYIGMYTASAGHDPVKICLLVLQQFCKIQ